MQFAMWALFGVSYSGFTCLLDYQENHLQSANPVVHLVHVLTLLLHQLLRTVLV